MTGVVPDGSLRVASRRVERGAMLVVREPWSGAELGQVVQADEALAEQATVASVQAFARLQAQTSYERKTVLARIAREIEEQQAVFAELLAREAGKPITMARAEVARAVSTFD